MEKTSAIQREKLQKLHDVVARKKKLLILTHDNPDPDGLAAAFALRYLISTLWDMEGAIAYGGMIGRAENRAMVKYLKMDIRPISDLRFRNFDIVALIDSQPGAGNNSLPETVSPEIIIDHHFPGYEDSLDAGFIDIRTECGSTSSILAEYLKNSGLESIDRHVATALIYGISSDTRDLGRETGPEDIAAYSFLYPWLNFRLLSKISHPRLPREYFRMFERAIERALIDKDVVISDLEKIHNTDSLSEMADLLIRLEHVNWALCFGEFNGWVHFSLRTGERQGHAGQIAKKIVAGIGAGGGHHVIAGGKVRQNSEMANAYQETTQLLKSRFFAEINRVDFRGKPL